MTRKMTQKLLQAEDQKSCWFIITLAENLTKKKVLNMFQNNIWLNNHKYGGFLAEFYRKADWGVKRGVVKGVEKLSENEKKIIELVEKNPYVSKAEMITEGNLTKKTVEYNIESLKRKGLLKRVGPAKGGYWKVINEKQN